MCCADWRRGSGTLPVSRVCDTVVRPRVHCIEDRASSSERRIVRAKSAIVDCGKENQSMARCDAFLVVVEESQEIAKVWRSCRDPIER